MYPCPDWYQERGWCCLLWQLGFNPCQIWSNRLAQFTNMSQRSTSVTLRTQPTFICAHMVLRCNCFGSPSPAISCDFWHRPCRFAPTDLPLFRKKSTLVLRDSVACWQGLGFRIVLPQALQICGCHRRSASTAIQWSRELSHEFRYSFRQVNLGKPSNEATTRHPRHPKDPKCVWLYVIIRIYIYVYIHI